MCQSIYYHFWDTARYLWKKSSFYHTPLHSTTPLRGFPSEYRHPLWDGRTRMVSLSDGEKISKITLLFLTWSTNVTDRQTDRHCVTAKTALASHRAVKIVRFWWNLVHFCKCWTWFCSRDQKLNFFKIQDGGGRHLENHFFGHNSSIDCPISAKFCMRKQNG